jgi:hypothetical protein
MLYTFKSSSAADVIMQRFSAEKMLSVLQISMMLYGSVRVPILFCSYSELVKLQEVMWFGVCEAHKQTSME